MSNTLLARNINKSCMADRYEVKVNEENNRSKMG